MKQVGWRASGQAQRIREQLDMLPEERMKQSFPDHLTRREVEVLRLIATGASNHDIVATLVLSVRTVERHISNIYGKIGVEGSASRAAATTYAMRHGLV